MADDLTPEQLEAVQGYAEAFRKEFLDAQANAANEAGIVDRRSDIHKELDEALPFALGTIKHVLKHSTSMSIKVSTAKWLIDKKLESIKGENDPLNKFLEKLAQQAQADVKEST